MKMSRNSDSYDFPIEPSFRGYQLIGDSQFLRFATTLLNKERKTRDGLAYLGLCVSGQKIWDLLRRIEDKFYRTSDKVIVMIGTNDLLQGTSLENMNEDLENLVCALVERGVRKVVLITIPPVPRLAKSHDHWDRLKKFNKHIKYLAKSREVSVIDAYPQFLKYLDKRHNSSSLDSSCTSIQFSTFSSSPKSSPKYKTDLRVSISVNSDDASREIFLLSGVEKSSNDSYSCGSENSLNESHRSRGDEGLSESFRRTIKDNELFTRRPKIRNEPSERLSLSMKRRYSSASFLEDGSPPPKRRNTSLYLDDHDDRFCEEDSSFSKDSTVADEINLDLFEEYFSMITKKQDLIHLNRNGLLVIKQLISNYVDSL